MQLLRFFDMVNQSEQIEGIGIRLGDEEDDDQVGVRDPAGSDLWLSVDDVMAADEKLLRAIIFRENTCQPLYVVTRIVGYFSHVENWNGGKIGELSDRRAGNYEVKMISPSSIAVTGESQPSKELMMAP